MVQQMIKNLEIFEEVNNYTLTLGVEYDVEERGWYNIYFELNGLDFWSTNNYPSNPKEALRIVFVALRMFEEFKELLKANGITQLSIYLENSDKFAKKRARFYNSKAVGFVNNRMVLE